jgi:hypothetical protein
MQWVLVVPWSMAATYFGITTSEKVLYHEATKARTVLWLRALVVKSFANFSPLSGMLCQTWTFYPPVGFLPG